MVTAFVLINAQRRHIPEVAEGLLEIDGVAEVYSVAGGYDLVAVLRASSNEQVAEIVTGRMAANERIEHTTTLISFQCYSRYDLEHIFSLGAEEDAEA